MGKQKKKPQHATTEQYSVKYRFKGEGGYWRSTDMLIEWPGHSKSAHSKVEKYVVNMLKGMGLKLGEFEIVNVTYC